MQEQEEIINILNENLVISAITAPTYYRTRADLLVPASETFDKDDMKTLTNSIIGDSLYPKGGHYFMCDKAHTISLLISELPAKRYSITLSTTGTANDFYLSVKDYDYMLEFVKSLKIPVEKFVMSNLNPKKVF